MHDITSDMHDIFTSFFSSDEDLDHFINTRLHETCPCDEGMRNSMMQSLVAAFLVCLCGKNDARYDRARQVLEKQQHSAPEGDMARFFLRGADLVFHEISQAAETDESCAKLLQETARHAREPGKGSSDVFLNRVSSFFFPQGSFWPDHVAGARNRLRRKRTVVIDELNKAPLADIGHEVIFTGNVLLTVPAHDTDIATLDLDDALKRQLADVRKEEQRYWFDHPVQIGTPPESNEVIYGLWALHEAVGIERVRGNVREGSRVPCVLSVSVTHEGLKRISRDYLKEEFKKQGPMEDLDMYAFTEDDTRDLVSDVLMPLAREYGMNADDLYGVFGVDGEYGRHYSFLKAVAALWQVFIDNRVKATFKIDLDQVFPQETLIAETGRSAFEHLMTPLWGARGRDIGGRAVFLGMLAGGLVNESDIGQGLFTPDVTFPDAGLAREDLIFASRIPQALSTEAEMMTRYEAQGLYDGVRTCLQRFHVTGGTTGILVEALRKYRPFTPALMGRAEDQAYILSVLFDEKEQGLLRYAHGSGLVMRHDKEAFAGEAIAAAKTGKLIGDYIRILLFSEYARSLPWDLKDITEEINPFTGAFVSLVPCTVVLLRFALSCASRFMTGSVEEAESFLDMGTRRISDTMRFLYDGNERLSRIVAREREAWHVFYDILERAEEGLVGGNDAVIAAGSRARAIIDRCRILS